MSLGITLAYARHILWRVALLLLLTTALQARATTVVKKDFAALCREADMIFAATVVEVRAQLVAGEGGHVETLVTFSAIEPIVGLSTSSVTLRFAGGTIDGIREEFLGVPRFAVGDRVVLFARNGYQLSPIVGVSQGSFRIVDSASGPTVTSDDGRAVAMSVLRGENGDAGGAAGDVPLSFDSFMNEVRNELRAQGRSD